MSEATREPQYASLLDLASSGAKQSFGLMSAGTWHQDPKRLVFLLSRYKFVSRMLEGQRDVVEIGCADGFGSRIVRQTVASLTGTDFDPVFVDNARSIVDSDWAIDFIAHDLLEGPFIETYTAAYALDVLEHIAPTSEDLFLSNLCLSLSDDGVAILGMPSLESQSYASPASVAGHVNCKSGADLRRLMEKHFRNVFLFSMNDEVVHTGYYPMAHYLLVLGVGPRRRPL